MTNWLTKALKQTDWASSPRDETPNFPTQRIIKKQLTNWSTDLITEQKADWLTDQMAYSLTDPFNK